MQLRNKMLTFILAGAPLLFCPSHLMPQESTRSRTAGSDQTGMRGEAQMRTDRLRNQIYGRLASSGSLTGSDINVSVDGNTAVLEGTVADERAKQRAARIATRVGGIEIVDNNLKIDQAAAQRNKNVNVPDDQLSKQIAEKLVSTHFKNARVEQDWMFGWEVEGNGFEFEVDVDGGDVTLSGEVPRPGVIADVLRTARSVPGVRTVRSELRADRYYREYGPWPYYWGYHPYPFY